tara:strand:- start:9 stop:2231 length:2223 start_codon:yes stop_codon:yes gene_type:complete
MQKRILLYAIACFFSFNVLSEYTYEANQSLIDLTNQSGTTNLNASDDGVSSAFNLGFTFDFYGQSFTQARIATNGCLHFKTSGAYCNDYTPDLLPEVTYTLYPFWTDLIRDNNSKMLGKVFNDKTVFGWYNLREYNRSSSNNSFEVILWTNDTFDFRYGGLDVIQHDVLIGEQGTSSQTYQYLFHDECGTGTTNVSGSCVSTDWNNTNSNTLLENGGSLYGVGTGNSLDCSDVLSNTACEGYAAAYLTQQCSITQLYSESCPSYLQAYDDQQCDDNSQYAPFCAGYRQESSVAYFDPYEFDYGHEQEDMWYDTEYDEWLDPSDPCYENACENFTDADWYELDVEQFGQEQVDQWFGNELEFSNDGIINWETTSVTSYDDIDIQMDIFDTQYQEDILIDQFTFQETFLVEDYSEPETFIEFNSIEELDEWFEEELEAQEELAETEEELQEIASIEEEPEEEFIEEIFEEEAVEEIFEEIEERLAEEEIREQEEEIFEEELNELEISEREERGESSMTRERAISVVNSTIRTANNSFSNTTSFNSSNVTNNNTSSVSNTSSSGGISTSSSPSRSDQFNSATMQSNTILSLNGNTGTVGNVSISITPMPALDNNPQVVMADVQVNNMNNQIDTAISGVMTSSEADQIADKIIANNIKEQQEEGQTAQEETGKYGEEANLVAYMGYVVGFDSYKSVEIPTQPTWYEDKTIYNTAYLPDNITGYYSLASSNISMMNSMISLQPNL